MKASEMSNELLASELLSGDWSGRNYGLTSYQITGEAAHRLRTMIPVPQVQVYHGSDGTYVRVCGKPITKVDSYAEALQIKEAIDDAIGITEGGGMNSVEWTHKSFTCPHCGFVDVAPHVYFEQEHWSDYVDRVCVRCVQPIEVHREVRYYYIAKAKETP